MSKMVLKLKLVLCSLFLGFVWCGSESFKAAVVDVRLADLITANKYAALINEAAKSDVDILVLPARKRVSHTTSFESCVDDLERFDEVVKSVSAASKNAQLYVVVPLHEKVPCQDGEELVTSSLVFDRTGALITLHRKSVTGVTKCNTTISRVGRFTTDFGVTFGVILEEDLILTPTRELQGIKNLIVTHSSAVKRSLLFAEQLPRYVLAFTNNVNVISADGKISCNDISMTPPLLVATLRKNGSEQQTLIVNPPSYFPSEDFSQYITKPLNLEASVRGYRESVCHGKFCCQFYVKTSAIGSDPQDVSYGLVAFDGMQQLGSNNIALQTCSVVACAGLYKRSCCIGSKTNTTNIKFNEISISANFSKENSAQFPNILTTTQTVLDKESLKFSTDKDHIGSVNAKLYNTENVLTFGIIGRDYSKDFESSQVNNKNGFFEFSEYISIENVQEFFDYVWIRLRVFIFIVSVYILEMM